MGPHHEEADCRAWALDVVCAPFRKCSQCWILHPLRLPPTLPKGWFAAMSLPLARQPPRRAPRRASSRARPSAEGTRSVRRRGPPAAPLGQLRHRSPQRLLNAHGGPHLDLRIGELGDDAVLPAHAAPGGHLAYELVLLRRAAERHRLAALASAVLARHPSYPLAPSSAAAISSCFVGNRCA